MDKKIKSFIELIIFFFEDLVNIFGRNKRIFIKPNKHPFWKTFTTSPPVKYLKSVFFAKIYHSFNRFPKYYYGDYIIDCEHILHLSDSSRDYNFMLKSAKKIEKKLNSKSCKAIVFPTNGAINECFKYLKRTPNIEKKIYKIPPAFRVKAKKNYIKLNDNPFTILNIGNKFWGKGTHIALEVFRRLREKYNHDIQMKLVCCDIPEDYPIPSGVKVIDTPNLTDELRDSLYYNSHLFLFPCLHDSFGVYLESLAYGLPMLSTKIYDKSEIVIHGQTGYLFETPISLYDGQFGIKWKNWNEFQEIIISSFYDGVFETLINEMKFKIEELISNPSLLKELSFNSQQFCKNELTIQNKNKLLKNLYYKCY